MTPNGLSKFNDGRDDGRNNAGEKRHSDPGNIPGNLTTNHKCVFRETEKVTGKKIESHD